MISKPRTSSPTRRFDPEAWKRIRDTIDLEMIATNLLGPPPGRRGGDRGRLWWNCPLGLHPDHNPSFCVISSGGHASHWHCFGCGESGDAVSLVRALRGCSFPEAVDYVTQGRCTTYQPRSFREPTKPKPSQRPRLTREEAEQFVEKARQSLWTAEGSAGLEYLLGPRRCLKFEVIQEAKLGWTNHSHRVPWKAPGIVIPWYDRGQLALIKVRVMDDWMASLDPSRRPPKYLQIYRDDTLHHCYPHPEVVRPGKPLIVVEGEFDQVCLAGELGDLSSVVTLGSASARPKPAILSRMLTASPWYVATDGDSAGDGSASHWPSSCRRVQPPEPFKDWTEAKAAGVDLRRWWSERFSGILPQTFRWPELQTKTWGPHKEDVDPGIVRDEAVELTDRQGTYLSSFQANDPYADEERLAIQEEARSSEQNQEASPQEPRNSALDAI